jgi:hypothetical protein
MGRRRLRAWLKGRSGAIVAVHYIELASGSTLVELQLTRSQLSAARGGHLVVVRI